MPAAEKVLIFGCSGFVGPYLAREFYSHGYRVYGTDIMGARESLPPLLSEYAQLDMLNFDVVLELVERIAPGQIINLAAISSVRSSWDIPQRTMDVNVNGALNILEAVRKLGLRTKILLVGSSEEYAVSETKIPETYPIDANNPYGISKIAQEHFAELYRREYGMRIISTRTFNHTGVGQSERFAIPCFVKQVADIHSQKGSGKIYVGNLSVRRDFGDVRDMVRAYRLLLESDTRKTVFNVGSGNCYSLEDLLRYVISLTPRSKDIELVVSEEKLRPVDNPVIWCDNALLRKETGWGPEHTVFDAINEMFSALTSTA